MRCEARSDLSLSAPSFPAIRLELSPRLSPLVLTSTTPTDQRRKKTTSITATTPLVLFAIIGTLFLAGSINALCCLVPCVPETPECLPECRYFAGRNKCDSHGDCSKCAMDDTLKVDTLGEIAEVEEQSPGKGVERVA